MPRRKTVAEAAEKAGLTEQAYVARVMGQQLRAALQPACSHIRKAALEGDMKACYFIVDFFGKWAAPEDPRDKLAGAILRQVARIRGEHDQSDSEAEDGGADDPDASGEAAYLEEDEDAEGAGGEALQALADV